MYQIPPDDLDRLEQSLQAAVIAAFSQFKDALRPDSDKALARAWTSGSAWRAYAQTRYRQGTFKHSVLEYMPFRPFQPVEIYGPHQVALLERHPKREQTLDVGTSNALRDLVDDGLVVKLGPALYSPAIDHVAVHQPNPPGVYNNVLRFETFILDVARRVVQRAPALAYAHEGDRNPESFGFFQSNARFVNVTLYGEHEDHVMVSGHQAVLEPVTNGRIPVSPQLFPNFGLATEIAINDSGADLLARAIVAWLEHDDDELRSVRRAVGLDRLPTA